MYKCDYYYDNHYDCYDYDYDYYDYYYYYYYYTTTDHVRVTASWTRQTLHLYDCGQ